MPKRALPATDAEEHQYWADPILSEETRARLEHFRSLGHLPLEGIAVVERYWRRSASFLMYIVIRIGRDIDCFQLGSIIFKIYPSSGEGEHSTEVTPISYQPVGKTCLFTPLGFNQDDPLQTSDPFGIYRPRPVRSFVT
jgi:hypothetical protein